VSNIVVKSTSWSNFGADFEQLRGPCTSVLTDPLEMSNQVCSGLEKGGDRLLQMCDGKQSRFHENSIAFS
jgi:hypothetical protein